MFELVVEAFVALKIQKVGYWDVTLLGLSGGC
jgi:hypothetical protein